MGVLFPLGDILIPWEKAPLIFAVFWGGMIMIACWICLLALGDYMASAAQHQTDREHLREQRMELEQELAQLRKHQTNGKN